MNRLQNTNLEETKVRNYSNWVIPAFYIISTALLYYYSTVVSGFMGWLILKVFSLCSFIISIQLILKSHNDEEDVCITNREPIKVDNETTLEMLKLRSLGFSQESLRKTRQLVETSFNEDSKRMNFGQKPTFEEDGKDNMFSDFDTKKNSYLEKGKSLFYNISHEWPSNILASLNVGEKKQIKEKFKEYNNKNSVSNSKLDIDGKRQSYYNEGGRTPASRNSISKSKNSVYKASVLSKSDTRKESHFNLDKISEQDNMLSLMLTNMQISQEKYNLWTSYNIQVWLAFNLFPEIFESNKRNLESILSVLRKHNKGLKNYSLISLIENEQMESVLEDRQDKVSELFYLDDLLVSNDIKELQELLHERIILDRQLVPSGYPIEATRLYSLKKLVALQKENFLVGLENSQFSKKMPTNEDLILCYFTYNILENDPYYEKNVHAQRNTFVSGFMQRVLIHSTDFQIGLLDTSMTCYFKDHNITFQKNIEGILSLVTLLAMWIQFYHSSYLKVEKNRTQKLGAFSELMIRLD